MDDDSELKMKNEERENFKEGNKMFRSEAGNKKEEFEDVWGFVDEAQLSLPIFDNF